MLYLLKNISTNKYLGNATPIVEDIQGQNLHCRLYKSFSGGGGPGGGGGNIKGECKVGGWRRRGCWKCPLLKRSSPSPA